MSHSSAQPTPPAGSNPNPDSPSPDPKAIEKIHLGGPVDLLTIMPHLIGYHPGAGDLVIIANSGRRVLTRAIIHLDDADTTTTTPASTDDVIWIEAVELWARSRDLLQRSTSEPVTGYQIVAYSTPHTSIPPASTSGASGASGALTEAPGKAETIATVLAVLDLPDVVEVLLVREGRWRSLLCDQPACCPPEGRPVPQDDAALSAAFVAVGSNPATSLDWLRDSLRPGPPALIVAVTTHLDTLTAAKTTTTMPAGSGETSSSGRDPLPQADSRAASRAAALAALRTAHQQQHGGRGQLSPEQAAVLLMALEDATVRDTCMAWHDDAARSLWADLVHHAPPGRVAPAATLLAATAYQRSEGVMARIAAEHALNDRPGYSLATLLLGLFALAITPEQLSQHIRDALAVTSDTASDTAPRRSDTKSRLS